MSNAPASGNPMSDAPLSRFALSRTAVLLWCLLGAAIIGVTLWSWGQPLVSRNGRILLWVGSIWSSENSQQVADWYSLSHAVQGVLVGLAGRALRRWIGFPVALAVVLVIGVGWEVVEHTDWVLNRFRAATIYQGYVGDTVLNAVCDYLFMLAGFFAAIAMPVWVGIGLALLLEVGSAVAARDSLVLTTVQLIHPVPVIAAWQDAINPRTHPAP